MTGLSSSVNGPVGESASAAHTRPQIPAGWSSVSLSTMRYLSPTFSMVVSMLLKPGSKSIFGLLNSTKSLVST